jgi:PEP-CTERM motif
MYPISVGVWYSHVELDGGAIVMTILRRNNISRFGGILLAFFVVGVISVDAKASSTIVTFDDPSTGSGSSLFTVDFTQEKFTGGWAAPGLTLVTPTGTYANAWFEMSNVTITSTTTITGVGKFGQVGPGEINFYANPTSITPLVTIDFESGLVSRYGFDGSDETPDGEIIAANVTIKGSAIPYTTLSDEQFSFSFANVAKLPGHTSLNDGFTATAAFTSSAEIPEPATLCLLGLGALNLLRSKRNGALSVRR